MLSHGENPKRIAKYVGNSPEVIYRSYRKWIGGDEGFGNEALEAAKPKPVEALDEDPRKCKSLKWCEGRDLNPYTLSGTSPSN